MYGYDRITFSRFYNCYYQPTGVFPINCLLTGRLQVRILFEEPSSLIKATHFGGLLSC